MQMPPQGFSCVPGFLNADEQRAIQGQLEALGYEHDVFRGQRLKRGYAQFGYAYVSTGRKVEPASSLPDFLTAPIAKALPYCPAGTQFNQCIVTHYPKGAGIGWHTDAPQFGDCIMAVSLGGDARLQFRRNGSEPVSFEVSAGPGSLYVMRGPARWEFQHQVVPVKSDRYSMTFRYVSGSAAEVPPVG